MKAIGLLMLALLLQSCFFHPYFKDKDSEWWYFEDWDTNDDRVIDKSEFITSFEKYRLIRRISPNAQSIGYADFDSLVVKLTKNAGGHIEDKATAASADTNGDQKLSGRELAAAMFMIADDNKNDKLSGLEFYEWEVYL